MSHTLPLRLIIVGHVDHGKSTLIGRLLHDTNSLPDGKLEELKAICARRKTDVMEWSYLLDSFQAERDQAVTIETTQIPFRYQGRSFVIIDAPGHREFLKNMVSGAAQADAALLIVDAEEGVREQTRRHAYLLKLLNYNKIIVVVNKLDKVNFDQKRFDDLCTDIEDKLGALDLRAATILPMSALNGDMLVERGKNLDWYKGPTLIELLTAYPSGNPLQEAPLRLPVQDIYRHNERRIIAGRIESGRLTEGDTLLFLPGNETAKVVSIEQWPVQECGADAKRQAAINESVAFTLDTPIYVERGYVASHVDSAPKLTDTFKARLFWLGHTPLQEGQSCTLRYLTSEIRATLEKVETLVDMSTLEHSAGTDITRNMAAEVVFRAARPLPFDSASEMFSTGRFAILAGTGDIAGGGLIDVSGYADQRNQAQRSKNITRVTHHIDRTARAERNGHQGAIFWFTGLSGAGKSTLAMAVERTLFDRGIQVYVLDGDNVRHGLCADLGFSHEDRTENIRRVGEVSGLMANAGFVTITAFISPYRADRDRVRAMRPAQFHEIYIRAGLEACEARDPKGLYKKARAGEIANFTGIGSPYEPPDNPDLIVDTVNMDVDECVALICDYIHTHTRL